jgi:hypothetical protein
MPVYKLDYQFVVGTEYWTNKWYVIATDRVDAVTAANAIATIMAGFVLQPVVLDKVRITPEPFLKNVYQDIALSLTGTAGAGPVAPLFNCARLRSSGNYGRQTNHYMRGTVQLDSIAADQRFNAGAITFFNGKCAQLMDLNWPLCDKNGYVYVYLNVSPIVGMRQLRRGSKRRVRPVI